MRKYILTVVLIISSFSIFSQTKGELYTRYEIDSLKRIMPDLRDSARIDCLNTLAYKYYYLDMNWKEYLDSSGPFSIMANKEAEQIGYKKGLGFSYLRLATLEKWKNDIHKEKFRKSNAALLVTWEKYLRLAILIGEQINNYEIIGKAYAGLFQKTWANSDSVTVKNNFKKAVYFLELAGKQSPTSSYRDNDFTTCKGCEGNELWLGGIYTGFAFMYGDEGNWVTALTYMKSAMAYYEKVADKEKLADAYLKLSDIFFRTSDYNAAVEACKRSISFYHEIGNMGAEIAGYTVLSKMFEIQGDFENGVEYGKKNILLSEKFVKSNTTARGGSRAAGQTFFWMCRLYKIAGDYETALEIIRKGRSYYPTPIDSISKANWTAEIGDVHRLMRNYDSAKYYLEPFKNSVNDFNNFGKVSLGYLYIDLKEYDKALELITPLSQFLIKIKRIMPPLANSLMIIASAYAGKKDYKNALLFGREALSALHLMKGRVMMISNYKILSDVFMKIGKFDSAYVYLDKYTVLKDSLINRQLFWKLSNYKKEAEEAKKEARLGFLDRDNKIKEEQLKQEAQLKKFLLLGLLGLLIIGFFIFRWLSLKRKNEKLRSIQLENEIKVQHLESEKKETEFQRKTTELEMQALRAQMNPHFIFNCLSSINRFILKNETKIASNYLTRFSRLMRMVLNNSQKPFISLDDELEMLELYLEMERLRFKNSFDYGITFLNVVDSDNIFIPPLLLQPFCENAIWHGLMHLPAGRHGNEGQGRLDIELSMQDNILNCIITDNGVGREKAEEMNSKTAEKEKSMGLKITSERLALLNREKGLQTFYEIKDLKDENGNAAGTKVILKISFKESVEEIA